MTTGTPAREGDELREDFDQPEHATNPSPFTLLSSPEETSVCNVNGECH